MISLETPQRKWASSRQEGRTSPIFSSCVRCSELTPGNSGTRSGNSGTRSGGLRKGQSPCELLGDLSGFLSRRCRGLRPCVESVPEAEVADMDLGVLLESPQGCQSSLEWGHARALSSRGAVAVSRFPSRGSRDLWLSLEAFPRRFPTRLSHRAVPRATDV